MREDGAAEGPKRPDGVNDKPPKAERRRRVSVKSPRESRRFPEHLLRAGHRAKCRGHAATYVASFPLGKSAAGHGVTAAPRSLPRTGLQTLPAAQRISGRPAGSSARWKAFPDDSPCSSPLHRLPSLVPENSGAGFPRLLHTVHCPHLPNFVCSSSPLPPAPRKSRTVCFLS